MRNVSGLFEKWRTFKINYIYIHMRPVEKTEFELREKGVFIKYKQLKKKNLGMFKNFIFQAGKYE